jgi:hypothetical protein
MSEAFHDRTRVKRFSHGGKSYSLECGSLLPLWIRLTPYNAATTKAAASCRTPKKCNALRLLWLKDYNSRCVSGMKRENFWRVFCAPNGHFVRNVLCGNGLCRNSSVPPDFPAGLTNRQNCSILIVE